ncbi:MAG: carboxylic ester hydrolase, partial [Phenylobacterium zucineum]
MPHIRPPVEDAHRGAALNGALAAAAEPLPDIGDPGFAAAFDRFGDARVVLLGEATHGTSEFYRARAAITRWLVEKRGFQIVALDADWPEARALDARVRGQAPPPVDPGRRFPDWMWRNREFDAFLSDLAAHNDARRPGDRVGVYGLDLYNLAGSMRAVVDHLDRVDPNAGRLARARYGCQEPWVQDPAGHGRMGITGRYAACEASVTEMLRDML